MRKPVYPNVRCGAGHPDEPGYVVCCHVLKDGDAIAGWSNPSSEKLGTLLCGRGHQLGEILLVCATCVRAKGLLEKIPVPVLQ